METFKTRFGLSCRRPGCGAIKPVLIESTRPVTIKEVRLSLEHETPGYFIKTEFGEPNKPECLDGQRHDFHRVVALEEV